MLRIEPYTSIYPIQHGQRTAGATKFSIPDSPLRNQETKPAAVRDPAGDSVELTRDFPALLVQQPYPPPSEHQAATPRAAREQNGLPEDTGLASDDEKAAETATATEEGEGGEGTEKAENGEATDARGEALDDTEQQEVQELKNRDREVRAHEQAHKAVGGSYAGSISYEYQQGPDGKRYAVGGEVSIDVSKEKDPEATIAKMRQVRAAAMAPAEPSPQDRSVAAQAMQTEAEARQELAEQRANGSGAQNGAGAPNNGENGDGEADGAKANGSGEADADAAPSAAPSRSSNTPSAANGPPIARLSSSIPAPYAGNVFSTAAPAGAYGRTPLDVIA